MSHDDDATCACVSEHRPAPDELNVHHVLPLSWGGLDRPANRVWVCPTTHANVHVLLNAYRKLGSTPPWELRRRFSVFTRVLAQRGWDAYVASS